MASRNPLVYTPVRPTTGGSYDSMSRSGGGFGANFAASLGRVLEDVQRLQGENADRALNREILARLENPESYEPGTPVLEQLGKAASNVTSAGLERAQSYVLQAPDVLRNRRALTDETNLRTAQDQLSPRLNAVLTQGDPNAALQGIADEGNYDSRTMMGLSQWFNQGRADTQANVRQSTGDIITTNEMNRNAGNLALARQLAERDLNEVGQDTYALSERYDNVIREHGAEVADQYQRLLNPAMDFDRNASLFNPNELFADNTPASSAIGSVGFGSGSNQSNQGVDVNRVSYNRNTRQVLSPFEERALPFIAVTSEGASPANKSIFENTINTLNRKALTQPNSSRVDFYTDRPDTPALGSLLMNADIENGRLDASQIRTPGFLGTGLFSGERNTYEVLMNSIDQLPDQARDTVVNTIDWAKIRQANDEDRGKALLNAVTYAASRSPQIARSIFGEEIPRDFMNNYVNTASNTAQNLPSDSVFHMPYTGNNPAQFTRWREQLQEQYGTDDVTSIPLREVSSGVADITKQVSGTNDAPLGAFQIVPRTMRDIAPKLFGRDWESMAFTPEVQVKMAMEEWRRSMNSSDPFNNLTTSRWSSLSKERNLRIPQIKEYVDGLRTSLRGGNGRNRPFTYQDAQMITLAETNSPLLMSEERFNEIMAKPVEDVIRDNQADTSIQRRTTEQLQAQREEQRESERQIYRVPESFSSMDGERKANWAVNTSQRFAQELGSRLDAYSSIGQRQLLEARGNNMNMQQVARERWGLSEKDTQNPDSDKRYRMGLDAMNAITERWRRKYPNHRMIKPMEAAIIAEAAGYNTETDWVGTNVNEAEINRMFEAIADGSYEQLGEAAQIMQRDLASITADLARLNELIGRTMQDISRAPNSPRLRNDRMGTYRQEESRIKQNLQSFAEKYQIPLSRYQ